MKPVSVILFVAILVFSILGIVSLLLMHPAVQGFAARQALESLTRLTGFEIGFDTVRVGPSGRVRVAGATLTEPDGSVLARIRRLDASVDLLALFRRQLIVGPLLLDGVEFVLREDADGQLSIATYGRSFTQPTDQNGDQSAEPEDTAAGTGFRLRFSRITILDSLVRYESHRFESPISVDQIAIRAQQLTIVDGRVAASIDSLSTGELFGSAIEDGRLNFVVDSSSVSFAEVALRSSDSLLQGEFSLDTSGSDDDVDSDRRAAVTISDSHLGVTALEALESLLPDIALSTLGTVDISLSIDGTLQRLEISRLYLGSGKSFGVRAHGVASATGQGDLPSFTGRIDRLWFTEQHLDSLRLRHRLPERLTIPDSVVISGPVDIGPTRLNTDLAVETSAGDGRIDLRVARDDNPNESPPSTYPFAAAIQFDNDLLDFESDGYFAVGDGEVAGTADLLVRSFRPDRFGLVQEPYALSAALSIETVLSSWTSFSVSLDLDHFNLIEGERVHRLENLTLDATAEPDLTQVTVDSSFLTASLMSTVALDDIADNLTQHVARYVALIEQETPDRPGGVIDFRLDLTEPTGLLVPIGLLVPSIPDLSELSPVSARLSYDGTTGELNARATVDRIGVSGFAADNLVMRVTSGTTTLLYDVRADRVQTDGTVFHSPALVGDARGDRVTASASLDDDEGNNLFRLGAAIQEIPDGFAVTFVPNLLIVRDDRWDISSDHQVTVTSGVVRVTDLEIYRDESSIRVHSRSPESETAGDAPDWIDITLFSVDLTSLASVWSAGSEEYSGMIDGSISIFVQSGGPFLAEADLSARDLVLDGRTVGTASVNASLDDRQRITLDAHVEQGESFASVEGWVDIANEAADLTVDLRRLDFDYLSGYIPDELDDARGYMEGAFRFRGTRADPHLTGKLSFRDAAFSVKRLGTSFSIGDDTIAIDRNVIRFSTFRLRDRRGNPATLDGMVTLDPEPANVRVELGLSSRAFNIMNTTARLNPRFYGVINIDSNLRIRGRLADPTVEGSVGLVSQSAVTLVLPESGTVAGDAAGIVRFIDETDDSSDPAGQPPPLFRGIALTTTIIVDRDTRVELIVDQRSGDRLQMRGGGDLSFGVDPGGEITLSGQYRVTDGTYVLSFFNVTRREFAITSGSTITWSGDPLEAELNVRALFSIRTSPAPLLMPAFQDRDEWTAPAGDLQFQVVLSMLGNLAQPEISFSLDMPPGERAGAGAAAYAAISQINEEESRRNTQAFALIVLNQFVADDLSGIDESAVFSAGARTSASQLLTYQLNALSNRFIRGVDVSFQVDSYEEFTETGPEGRTEVQVQVSQRLLNDRLIIRFGGRVDVEGDRSEENEWADLAGDVSVEYLLTRDGRYRARAFREHGYQGPLDGSVTTTGISFMFTQNFDRIRLPQWLRRKEDE